MRVLQPTPGTAGCCVSSDTKTDIWMPFAIGDYLADTSHLSTLEHGAYLLLLMHYWRKGPLPNDLAKIAQIAKLNSDARSIAQALLDEFFSHQEDGLYHQNRSDREIAKWQGKRQKAREKAAAAARARWKNDAPSIPPSNAQSNAQAMLGQCPLPSPKPIKKNLTPKAFVVPEWVPREPWEAWLEIRKKVRAKNTDYALSLALKDLEKLRNRGEDPTEVLNRAILGSWKALYPKSGNGISDSKISVATYPSGFFDDSPREAPPV